MPTKLNEQNALNIVKGDETEFSFIKLYKNFEELDVSNYKDFREAISEIQFNEEAEIEYNGLPVKVSYAQLPIVSGDNILVKVVLLEQGEDGIVLIVPENVASIYEEISKNPDRLKYENIGFSLLAEVIGLDSNDAELLKTIKSTYLSAADYMPAFDFISRPETDSKEQEVEEEQDDLLNVSKSELSADEEVNQELLDNEDVQANLESFSKIKRNTDSLFTLVESITKVTPKVVSDNIKIGYLNTDKTILFITVNNKDIYSELASLPTHAKKLISEFGEHLKSFKNVQLLDSIKHGDSRVFILSEAVGNNYWITEQDNVRYAQGSGPFVKVKDEDLIILKKSSVKVESRKRLPYIKDGDIVFKDGGLK